MQKEIKLIVTDIDGTLIKEAGCDISASDLAAIHKAQAMGVPVTIATGRILSTAYSWVEKLNIKIPVITCNGADIRDAQQSYFTDSLNEAQTRCVTEAMKQTGAKRYVFSDNKIFCLKQDYWKKLFDKWESGGLDKYPCTVFETEEELYAAAKNNIQKVLFWAVSPQIELNMLRAARTLETEFNVVSGEPGNIEVNSKHASKGVALAKLAEMMGAELGEVLAIGDGENDVEMLRAAGVGVAMKSGMPKAIEAAEYITESPENNGVAKAIERFVFKQKEA